MAQCFRQVDTDFGRSAAALADPPQLSASGSIFGGWLSWTGCSTPIRQVLRDLTDAPLQAVSAERARVAMQGWAARLLALRGEDGQWTGGACFPADFRGDFSKGRPWTATLPSLTLLRGFRHRSGGRAGA